MDWVDSSVCASVHLSIRSHILDMYGPILFKLGKKTIRNTYAHHFVSWCNARWPNSGHFSCKNPMLNTSSTISRTCIYRCCSNLASSKGMTACICTSFSFSIIFKMADWRMFLKCVPNHFSDMHGPILLNLAQAQHMMAYTRTSFYFVMWSKMADWWTGGHFSWKKQPGIKHILNHFSNMHLPILFKLGKQITNGGFHMHVNFFPRSDPRWPTGGHFSCK